MAGKLVPLSEAAQILGVSADELNEMRLRQEIYGYRDGASWKFKIDDVERLKEERASSGSSPSPSGIHDSGSLPVDIGDSGDDVVLLSELELGESGPSTSSTVIGQAKSTGPIDLIVDDDLKLADNEPTLKQSDMGGREKSDDLLGLAADSGLSLGLTGPEPGDSGKAAAGSSDLFLVDSGLGLGQAEGPKSDLTGGDSQLNLGEDAEDVLGGGSGSHSDITRRPSDSGILLIDPEDSGLALDQPLDLTGSSKGDADDDLLGQTSDFQTEVSVELKADDDFLLTPLEEATDDESDSGSQVIMLDTEGEFDDATATLLASQIPGLGAGPMLEEESPLGNLAASPLGFGGATPIAAQQTVYISRETPFSAMTVLGLTACTLLLALGGIMMYDLLRNIWSWDGPYPVTTTLVDSLSGLF
jgi:hypothetical protein